MVRYHHGEWIKAIGQFIMDQIGKMENPVWLYISKEARDSNQCLDPWIKSLETISTRLCNTLTGIDGSTSANDQKTNTYVDGKMHSCGMGWTSEAVMM
jgi:hypothetical protein